MDLLIDSNNFGISIPCKRTKHERIDERRKDSYDGTYAPPSSEKEARIIAHQKRVQRELANA